MNEKLKEFAAQAGFNLSWDYHCDEYELEQFAQLVRQDEREACAALCDKLSNEVCNKNFIAVDQRKFCAKQIRARGEHGQD